MTPQLRPSKFRIDDLEHPWVYETPFDLVHSRLCAGSAIRNWPEYLAESLRCLRPGGWVEAQEINVFPSSDDDSFPPDSAILKWHRLWNEGLLQSGCDMHWSSDKLKAEMEKAGFVNGAFFKVPNLTAVLRPLGRGLTSMKSVLVFRCRMLRTDFGM